MYEIYRKLRDEKKCKDADVAKATGITKSTFSDWKSGRSKPKDEKLKKIAEFFGVSVDYLTGHQPIVDFVLKSTSGQIARMSKHTEYDLDIAYDKDIEFVIESMKKLNEEGKKRLYYYAKEISCNPLYNTNYASELNAAHERTDTVITEEMIQNDDDIMNDNNF